MKIAGISGFKNPERDHAAFFAWVAALESQNNKKYERLEVQTALGKTLVWKLDGPAAETAEKLVIFPGFRTTPLFWDLENNLALLQEKRQVYLVETNGQPNPSDGNTPAIKSLDYGKWAEQVLNGLHIDKAWIAGASFGCMVAMKLSIVAPEKVKGIFLLNPGGLRPISLGFKNLYYNLLPILITNPRTVRKFLTNGVFYAPEHQLSEQAMQMCIDFELLALKHYKDNTQKPYFMGDQLKLVKVPAWLLIGNKDLLFPYEKTVENARTFISSLQDVVVFENVGHGSETYAGAIKKIDELIVTALV